MLASRLKIEFHFAEDVDQKNFSETNFFFLKTFETLVNKNQDQLKELMVNDVLPMVTDVLPMVTNANQMVNNVQPMVAEASSFDNPQKVGKID